MAAEGMSLVSRSLRISLQMLESSDSIRVKKRRRSGLQSGSSGLRSGFCVCVCVFFFFSCCDRCLKEEVWVAIWVQCFRFVVICLFDLGDFGMDFLLWFLWGGRWISSACLIWVIFCCDFLLLVILMGMGLLEVEGEREEKFEKKRNSKKGLKKNI